MSPFLQRSRWVSLAIAYALIYTQIFGSFQGDNPLDISQVSLADMAELFVPVAHAAPSPTPVAFLIEDDAVNTRTITGFNLLRDANGNEIEKSMPFRYRQINYIEDGKKCKAVFIFKVTASSTSKVLKNAYKKCVDASERLYPSVQQTVMETGEITDVATLTVPAAEVGASPVPLLARADQKQEDDRPADEVAYKGSDLFTYAGAIKTPQGFPEAPTSLVSGDIGQAGAPTEVTKPGDKQDTGIRSQAGLNVDRTSDKPGPQPVIDPNTGKPFTTGKSRFYQFDPAGAASLKPEMEAQPQVNRKYLSAEEAGKFIKAATTAYNDAHRFLYGMSLISSVNYFPFDSDKAPPDHFLNVIAKKIQTGREYVDDHKTILTWDLNSTVQRYADRRNVDRKAEFEKLIQFFNPGTNPQRLPNTYEPVELTGCDDAQRPYVLRYGGSDFKFEANPGFPDRDVFFWLQYKYDAQPAGALGGAAKSACIYDASRTPKEFRVVGVSSDSVNYVGVLADATRHQWHEFKNEENVQKELAKVEAVTYARGRQSSRHSINRSAFHPDGQWLYRSGKEEDDPFFPVVLDEGNYTRGFNLDVGGHVGYQTGASIPREERQALLNIWLQTGLKIHEVLFLYFYTHQMSMLEHVRGILPVGQYGSRDGSMASNTGYAFPMAPGTNSTIKLLKGSQYYVGHQASPYADFFDFSNWIFSRLVVGPKIEGMEGSTWDLAVPLVGSGFEMASLLAFQGENTFIHERQPAQMQAHARKVVSMIPAFRLYQTQFAVEGATTPFNSIEVALRDRKDLSKVGTTAEEFINLGLIPEKPDKAADAAPRSVELGTGFQIEPIAVAHRGMDQIWRLHRPAGFPMQAGDDASVTELKTRLSLPSNDVGVGLQWSEAKSGNVFGKRIVSGRSIDTDILLRHMVNYQKLAEAYNKAQVEGVKSNTAPLAMDEPAALKSTGSSKTFFGRLTQFETKVYEGMLSAYTDSSQTVPGAADAGNSTITALKDLGEALSDGEAIWVMYLQEGRGAEDNIRNIRDDDPTGRGAVQETDPNITHKIHIRKISANNPLALNSLLSVEPNKPHGLIIPPIYSRVLNGSIMDLYQSGTLLRTELDAFHGVDLHYHDVLWVEQPQSADATVGETFTGADLVAATLRFNMFIMYLMTFVCLNEASFNSMISGFHDLMGPDYEGLVGESKPAVGQKPDKQNEIQKVVARMIKRIEDNKQVVMDQCWATPFIPLRAFKFPKTNVDQVVNTTIKEMGLDSALYSLSPGFGNGFELDKTVGGKLSGMKPLVEKEKCGAGGALGYITFGLAGNQNCPGWMTMLQIGTTLIFLVAVIYALANLGVFGKSAKKSVSSPGK